MTLDRDKGDLSKYASLLTAAKADQDRGDLKAAYATYLEAHGVIIRILSSQVVFKDNYSLESAPGNYTQLLAHAQEILRRLKDIVDLTKSNASTSLSPALPTAAVGSKSSKPSSISPIRPGLGPSQPSQRSVATIATTTTQNYKRTRKNIPIIPISPLTKQSLLHSYALSQVTQKLEQAKQGSSPQQQQQPHQGAGSPSLSANRDLAHLRRLIEDVRIQRAKLDTVNIQIQSVASSTITSWDPDTIAKQLTIIDTQLFKDVAIPRDLVRADRHHNSRAQNCIDFENYVAHSFAHLLLLEWIAVRQPSPASSPAASKNHSHTPINAVVHTIRIAHILLHVYRNFNGFRAVMRALTSPEIKRMHKLWSGVPSKTKDTYRRLVAIYQDQAERGGYKGALIQKLDAFQDVGRDAMVAIPWMRYHQDEVISIIQSYLSGQESSGGTTDIVLSAPGARKLSAVTALLLQCRSNDAGNFDRQETDSRSGHVSHTKHREPVQVDGLKTPLSPVWDLISLGAGDFTLHHWLLSRPFLNKQQLIDESLEIEPLFNGEELPCYETPMDLEDSDDSASLAGDVDQDESFEQVIQPEHDLDPLPAPSTPDQRTTRPAWTRTPVSESEVNDIMNELLNDDASDGQGLFGDSDDDNDNNDARRPGLTRTISGASSTNTPQRARDVFEFLGIQPEDASGDDDEAGGGLGNDQDAPSNSSSNNKGKALWSGNDDEELDSLMAKVKGLVHESKAFTQEVESKPESIKSDSLARDDFDSDPWSKDDDAPYSSGKKFEPFQQGDEDEWGFDSPAPPTTSTPIEPAPSALSTLDALRKQFANLSPVPDSDEIAENSISPRSEANVDDRHDTDSNTKSVTTFEEPASAKPGNVLESDLSPPSTSATGSAAASPPASSNPFTPFMITKSADSTPNVIGKARKRKIIVDRSGHPNNDLAVSSSFPGDKTPTALSPPRHTGGPMSPLDASDETMAAIATKAKLSLSGFQTGTNSASGADTVGTDGHSENKDAGEITVVSPPSKSVGSGSSDDVESVSIQELDKLAALFRSIDVKFTLTVDGSSDGEDDDDDDVNNDKDNSDNEDEFSCSTAANEDEHRSQQEEMGDPRAICTNVVSSNSNAEGDKSKSPRSDHEGEGGAESGSGSLESRTTRANRQRRRIAGGVISLPNPSKTLGSMKSTSSLSNAFKDSMASDQRSLLEEEADHSQPTAHEQEPDREQEPVREQVTELEQGRDETLMTVGGKAALLVDDLRAEAETGKEAGDSNGAEVDDVETRTKNGDLMTETMLADVEADVTIDEANSLLKSPVATAVEAAQVQATDDTEGGR
ncbi:hypothetical protein BGZ95_001971 [Linnemannia exigua]|uniref:Ras-GEF domain-containing protein n=1 Tax=Linnemannia exigua TaxID=604196 RepID=A0AAD4D644_9FUNG|nr:hypothetical protein BGZ95_001971 [Linnemannia exigua]